MSTSRFVGFDPRSDSFDIEIQNILTLEQMDVCETNKAYFNNLGDDDE